MAGMEMASSPQVEHAHQTGNGILVYFDDGKIAFFSAAVLWTMLSQAIEFDGTDIDEK